MTLDPRRDTWVTSNRFVPRAFVRPFLRFSQIEASSGIVLLAAAIVAVIWANSPWAETYFSLLETPFNLEFGPLHLEENLGLLINDGLMAIFFFVVGIEIKRELLLGDLSNRKAAALPVFGALGGMIVPALIYYGFNIGTDAAHGWGIPMATDIAFAVGVVALLGSRVPTPAKLFLLALAIADDIGAIAVIAIFYSSDISLAWLAVAAGGLLAVWLAQRVNIRPVPYYIALALIVWYATLESGVHATIAGVALGFLTPHRPLYNPKEFDSRSHRILDTFPVDGNQEHIDHEAMMLADTAYESVAPLNRLEHKLQPWSAFLVIPLFALANAGVSFEGINMGDALTHPVTLGVAVGLVVGKTIGVSVFAWIAVRLGLGNLPAGTTWRHIVGMGAMAGIGFTVAIFVAGLAFENPSYDELAKVGIFLASAVAGVLGTLILLRANGQRKQ
ncbi:MAG: Na+/H+ antiporter NhaA [Acidimicrobiia bacterium]|nr:Na+/H+ antiporter NhaA [Acidimicrobiia bacterium]